MGVNGRLRGSDKKNSSQEASQKNAKRKGEVSAGTGGHLSTEKRRKHKARKFNGAFAEKKVKASNLTN